MTMDKDADSNPLPLERNSSDSVEQLPQLADLYVLVDRMNKVAAEYDRKRQVAELAMHEKTLETAFGVNGSWLLSAAVPSDGHLAQATETPFAERQLCVVPPSIDTQTVKNLLEHWGGAAINIKGRKHAFDTLVGQDNLCIAHLDNGWEMCGVFDGHGPIGHWPASRVALTLPFFLQSPECTAMINSGEVEAALEHAILLAETDLEAETSLDLSFSGTTAVVMLRHQSQSCVWVASVGDSRAILLHPEKGVLGQTVDHKPGRPDEAERIQQSGCEVAKITYDDGLTIERVFIEGTKFPGICMTRSLGDLAMKEVGLIANPEVVKYDLQGLEGAHLLLASDGVFDALSTHDASEIVCGVIKEGGSSRQAMELLLKESLESWNQMANGPYSDDITMVLTPLTGSSRLCRWDDVDFMCQNRPTERTIEIWELHRRTTIFHTDWQAPFLLHDGEKCWRWLVLDGNYKRHTWTQGTQSSVASSNVPPIVPPQGWGWIIKPGVKWTVVNQLGDGESCDKVCDEDGWQYAADFYTRGSWWKGSPMLCHCRRRLWTCTFLNN